MENILLTDVALAAGNGGFFSQVFIMMLGVFAAAYLLKGEVRTGGIINVFILAAVIIVLNKTLGAILDVITSPFNFVTFGLFTFIIDAFIIKIAEKFLSKFSVKSFWTAIMMAIIISVTTVVVEWFF